MSAIVVSAADLPSDRFALAPHSSREAEVNRLVAEELRDREIGEALFISHRTVMRHMTNVLAKFEVPSRERPPGIRGMPGSPAPKSV